VLPQTLIAVASFNLYMVSLSNRSVLFFTYFVALLLRNTNVPHCGFRKQQQLGPSAAPHDPPLSKLFILKSPTSQIQNL
jgi:hypothetical protein